MDHMFQQNGDEHLEGVSPSDERSIDPKQLAHTPHIRHIDPDRYRDNVRSLLYDQSPRPKKRKGNPFETNYDRRKRRNARIRSICKTVGSAVAAVLRSSDSHTHAEDVVPHSAPSLPDVSSVGIVERAPWTLEVQSGDTLWDLIEVYLGGDPSDEKIDSVVDGILAEHPGFDPYALRIGMRITFSDEVGQIRMHIGGSPAVSAQD